MSQPKRASQHSEEHPHRSPDSREGRVFSVTLASRSPSLSTLFKKKNEMEAARVAIWSTMARWHMG